ncbi:MAG TPA: hypothetical protein VHU61_14590 [Solirubrobacteraceae bacterium]|nr:hypothetical protein [Solirubrobacteraceae bacterium]
MYDHWREWLAALLVLVLTVVAVVLDIADSTVRNFWYRHSFTSSVVAGLLVLLLTVLLVDRVNRMRKIKDQSRAIGVQAAVIVVQAGRAADAITRASPTEEDRDEAGQELRTFMQMLLTSAPVLIEARASRRFLEVAQQTAGEFFRALRLRADDENADVSARVAAAVEQLHQVSAAVVVPLNREERAAVASGDAAPGQS